MSVSESCKLVPGSAILLLKDFAYPTDKPEEFKRSQAMRLIWVSGFPLIFRV